MKKRKKKIVLLGCISCAFQVVIYIHYEKTKVDEGNEMILDVQSDICFVQEIHLVQDYAGKWNSKFVIADEIPPKLRRHS